jgi:hypothetical protein
MPAFKRGISSDFVKKLKEEYERDGWWRKIVSDPELFVAIRNESVNVYYKGNSLLRLTLEGERLAGTTHYKYLLRPELKNSYIRLKDGLVKVSGPAAFFISDLSELELLKQASSPYAGEEKEGVHEIGTANPKIIDVEVAFGQASDDDEIPPGRRIDFAALSEVDNGACLLFYEAKLFSNKELKASESRPPRVLKQMNQYEKLVIRHSADLTKSYRTICSNLIDLDVKGDRYSGGLRDLMHRVANGEVPLRIDPAVRLAVFGFDADQRDGKVWKAHKEKLTDKLGSRVHFKGDPKKWKLK